METAPFITIPVLLLITWKSGRTTFAPPCRVIGSLMVLLLASGLPIESRAASATTVPVPAVPSAVGLPMPREPSITVVRPV